MHQFPNLIISPKGQKPAIYPNTGSGRDTYISFNNGGNFPPEARFLMKAHQPNQFQTGMCSPHKNTDYLPQRIRYFSDGTGRDSYVVNGVKDKVGLQNLFQQQLREYPQSPNKLVMKLPAIEIIKREQQYRQQKQLIMKLSHPKIFATEQQ